MKKLISALSAVTLLSFSAEAVLVDGYCFLENQTNHESTKVLFLADSPSAVTDSTYTDSEGYYQKDLTLGAYDVFFTHQGFLGEEILDQIFVSPTTLPDVTLIGIPDGILISGPLSGVLEDTTYIVEDEIYVTIGDSLSIEPGAVFYFLGTYSFTINGSLYAEGTVSDSIKFMPVPGVSAWNGIDFSGSGSDSSILDYCFITGSISSGISSDNSSPTISHCTINGNSASNGGGIYCHNSASPSIIYCTISGNSTNNGGGIYCASDARPIVSYCTISDNSASMYGGGGIYWENCNPTISNCTLNGNSATYGSGGGINCSFTSSTIENCTFTGNSTNSGGGISVGSGSSPTISHCMINGNSAVDGGGISCYGNLTSSPTISHCTISGNSAGWTGAGIYCNAFSPTIVNTIVEGNTGNGGIYFWNSLYPSVTYGDFYNNGGGSFTGSPPQYLGVVVMVNANGDSCDLYYNIFEDPLFVDPAGGDFHLQADSPCIDAGDPTMPLDPDSTIADIGAFYYDQGIIPWLNVTLTPHNPPIQIPASGGSFDFNIEVANTGTSPATIDGWIMVTLPGGSQVGPVLGPVNLTLPAGASIDRDRTQMVPATAPSGMYTYDAYVGVYPGTIWDEDHFDFEKLVISDGGFLVTGWNNWGESFEDPSDATATMMPAALVLYDPNPNPFNPITTISFVLPDAAHVRLLVHDVSGRLVTTLVDNWREAGMHEVTFDGSNLASGVYIYKLEAGDFAAAGKMVLIK